LQHEELVVMIPVDKNDPNIQGSKPKRGAKTKNGKPKKSRRWKMPAKNLFNRITIILLYYFDSLCGISLNSNQNNPISETALLKFSNPTGLTT